MLDFRDSVILCKGVHEYQPNVGVRSRDSGQLIARVNVVLVCWECSENKFALMVKIIEAVT